MDLEDVVKVCECIGKNKRFSTLAQNELQDLWKVMCKFLFEQLLLKKSINIHGIGSFFTKKNKGDEGHAYSAHFSPFKNWDKLQGYQIDRTVLVGTTAAEPLNLAAIAQQIGFTRDVVESGIKDIVNALTRILRKGTVVHLTMGQLGKLIFNTHDVKFKFSPIFTKLLNDGKSILPPMNPKVEKVPVAEVRVVQEKEQVIVPTEVQKIPEKIAEKEEEKPKVAPEVEKDIETNGLLVDLDVATRKLAHLEQLIEETFAAEATTVSSHTHHHSGNRLWTDRKCPICKAGEMNNAVDRQLEKYSEKDNEKMLLQISLEIDKQYLDKKKEREQAKMEDSLATAQYNRFVGIQEKEKNQFRERQPMGDVFEKRKVQMPIMSSNQMAKGIQEQIKSRQERLAQVVRQSSIQEKLISEVLRKEYCRLTRIKAAELQTQYEKHKKCQNIRATLAEQIRAQQSLKEKEQSTDCENPFARSESLMAMYQREKAKQLYHEQLAIVRQRQDYAKKVNEIERKHSLTRLEHSRKELEKDLNTIKKGKTEMRHSLETYWSDQIQWKKQLQKELDSNA